MCLLSFNLRSLASTCSSSVGNNFSFESAHLKALFCNTCNFFLVSFDAECIKIYVMILRKDTGDLA